MYCEMIWVELWGDIFNLDKFVMVLGGWILVVWINGGKDEFLFVSDNWVNEKMFNDEILLDII